MALDAVLAVTVGGGLLAGQLTRLRGRLSTELDDATPSRSDGTIPKAVGNEAALGSDSLPR